MRLDTATRLEAPIATSSRSMTFAEPRVLPTSNHSAATNHLQLRLFGSGRAEIPGPSLSLLPRPSRYVQGSLAIAGNAAYVAYALD
jgi:hypothetical protein